MSKRVKFRRVITWILRDLGFVIHSSIIYMRFSIYTKWLLLVLHTRHFRILPFLTWLVRPLILLTMGVLVPLLTFWWLAPEIIEGIVNKLHRLVSNEHEMGWREGGQFFLVLGGALVGFIIWAFRDANMQRQIENQRKDVNLKEFQEIQQRAAGAFGPEIPKEAREALQIAALHQLRGFLSGQYGKEFQQPAFEMLLAGHQAACEKLGTSKITQWCESDEVKENSHIIEEKVRDAICYILQNESAVDATRRQIIADEYYSIFHSGYRLSGRCFDLIEFPKNAILCKLDFSHSSFIGSSFIDTNLYKIDLSRSNLSGLWISSGILSYADISYSKLYGANIGCRHMYLTNLSASKLSGASFSESNLNKTKLEYTVLIGTDLSESNWVESNISESVFDEHTVLSKYAHFGVSNGYIYVASREIWNDLDVKSKNVLRDMLIVKGAKFIE